MDNKEKLKFIKISRKEILKLTKSLNSELDTIDMRFDKKHIENSESLISKINDELKSIKKYRLKLLLLFF
jgi:hypothetical protein